MMCFRYRVNEMVISEVCVCVCARVCVRVHVYTHSDIKNEVSALDSGRSLYLCDSPV